MYVCIYIYIYTYIHIPIHINTQHISDIMVLTKKRQHDILQHNIIHVIYYMWLVMSMSLSVDATVLNAKL